MHRFSNLDTIQIDKTKCLTCPDGFYSQRNADYKNFLESKQEFSNKCVSKNINLCKFLKGWKFLENKIVSVTII
jgi:hypothetical protein